MFFDLFIQKPFFCIAEADNNDFLFDLTETDNRPIVFLAKINICLDPFGL
jgi:hypothetical protein